MLDWLLSVTPRLLDVIKSKHKKQMLSHPAESEAEKGSVEGAQAIREYLAQMIEQSRSNADAERVPPSISNIPGVADASSYWPMSLAHLHEPYDTGGSEYLVIGEISESPVNGFNGYRKLSTALVPYGDLDDLLSSTRATSWHVECHGPRPCVDEHGAHIPGFWIEGLTREVRYEPLVNAWSSGEHEVMLPDNNILMVYGLVPRYLGNGMVCWDDPHTPVYDVLRVQSHADLKKSRPDRTNIVLEMRRDYLADYCSLKQSAVVAFYYEERRSDGDATFDTALAGGDESEFALPGRSLDLYLYPVSKQQRQLSKVWGRRLVIAKGCRLISEAEDPVLVWPDHVGPMSLERAGRDWLYAYISDAVLIEYQFKPEFRVSPETGSVSYRGQWSVSYLERYGRNHIKVELKKLYEGCPPTVISYWHKFAVAEVVANHDKAAHGANHIGQRAKSLVYAFLALTSALARIGDQVGLSFSQADFGEYARDAVDYSGWWTFDGLKRLGDVAPMSSTVHDFLDRAITIVKLLESLKQAPLRNLVLKLGVDKQAVADLKPLRLIGTLCQLGKLAKDGGHHWPDDVTAVVPAWDAKTLLPVMQRCFAINQIRILAAHNAGPERDRKLIEHVKPFGIDIAANTNGWGLAIDRLYDTLTEDFGAIATLLSPSE